jgi:hypothetical protein
MKLKRKILVGTAITLTVAGGAGAAFAYFTAKGTEHGTATVGVVSDFVITPYPPTGLNLDVPQPVHFVVVNNGGGTQRLSKISISIKHVTGGPITATHGCDKSDFLLTQPDDINVDLPSGGVYNSTLAPVTFRQAMITLVNNTAVNQDNCQGAHVDLQFDAS